MFRLYQWKGKIKNLSRLSCFIAIINRLIGAGSCSILRNFCIMFNLENDLSPDATNTANVSNILSDVAVFEIKSFEKR